jgi:hypothetical protein
MNKRNVGLVFLIAVFLALAAIALPGTKQARQKSQFLGNAEDNAKQLIDQGRQIFRFDTYGDEAFWSGQLQMQQAVSSLTPANALALGLLKVDVPGRCISLSGDVKRLQ